MIDRQSNTDSVLPCTISFMDFAISEDSAADQVAGSHLSPRDMTYYIMHNSV